MGSYGVVVIVRALYAQGPWFNSRQEHNVYLSNIFSMDVLFIISGTILYRTKTLTLYNIFCYSQVIANRYGVRAIPVFLFFRNGERIHTVKGADMGSLDAAITQHLAGAISTQPSGGAEAPKVPGQVNHLNSREPSQAELNE